MPVGRAPSPPIPLTPSGDEPRPPRWGFRDKARECEELAHVARDPLVQQQILEIAEKWRTMAAFEEKFER